MDTQRFDMTFTWQKPSIGYTWENCLAISEDYLGRKFKVPEPDYLVERDYSQDMIVYQPLDDSTIFANFADLEPGPSTFVQWANKHGPLVGGESLKESPLIKTLIVLPKESIEPKKTIHHSGVVHTFEDGRRGYGQLSESLQFWHKEHEDLSFAFFLWELANLKDIETLEKVVEWNDERSGVEIWKIGRYQLPTTDMNKVRERDLKYIKESGISLGYENLFDVQHIRPWASKICLYPDVIRPAMLYAQLCINRKLKEFPLNFVIQVNEQGRFFNVLQPTSLLSAMWYQFLLVIRGDVKIRRCDVCGKWEDMKTHRENWHRHKSCASIQRVVKSRLKAKEARQG
jgi:hypothetical protein